MALLGTALKLRQVTLPNRIAMAPMSTGFASENGEVTSRQIGFYKERAAGGAGLIIVEVTCVAREFGMSELCQLSIEGTYKLDGHVSLVRAIEEQGSVAGIQLQLPGRHCDPRTLKGGLAVAPSDVFSRKDPTVLRARGLTDDEIVYLIRRFAEAATVSVQAGYRLIELHGAHGYLLMAFLSPLQNRRHDRWGGTLHNRMRFALETVRAVRAAIGPEIALSFRLSGEELQAGGLTIEDMEVVAPELAAAGVDILHVSAGTMDAVEGITDPMSEPEGWRNYLASRLRSAARIPVMAVGLRWPHTAERALGNGTADVVSLGRPLLADPLWARKAINGDIAAITPCTNCNWCVDRVMHHDAVGCAENPRVGRESESEPASAVGGTVIVVGGGPAGLTAALELEKRGRRVILHEARSFLGGGLVSSAAPPHKDRIGWYRDHLVYEIAKSGVEVRISSSPSVGQIVAERAELVVLATGAVDQPQHIPSDGSLPVLSAYELLMGESRTFEPQSGMIVVYGGGETGCETAEHISSFGCSVMLITRSPASQLARSAEPLYRRGLLKRLSANERVVIADRTQVASIADGVLAIDGPSGRSEVVAQALVVAQGRRSGSDLEAVLTQQGIAVEVVGDAHRIGRIGDAVHEAFFATRSAAFAADGFRGSIS